MGTYPKLVLLRGDICQDQGFLGHAGDHSGLSGLRLLEFLIGYGVDVAEIANNQIISYGQTAASDDVIVMIVSDFDKHSAMRLSNPSANTTRSIADFFKIRE